MSYKIPPSLNWLINKHARISGEIIKIQKRLTKVSLLVDRLRELEKNLEAVNSSLRLHEIQIDAKNIKPIRPTKKKVISPGVSSRTLFSKSSKPIQSMVLFPKSQSWSSLRKNIWNMAIPN